MNNNDGKLHMLTQNKSQSHFLKHEPSPRKTHRKQIEQHSSPQPNNQTSLSFTKSQLQIQLPKSQTSHHESTYVALLIQQIKNLEATVESLREENERLKQSQTIGYLDVQFQHKQLNKYHDLLRSVQSLRLDNMKIKKQYEQMQLMMKIHLAPINEVLLQLKQTKNDDNKQSLADFPLKEDSRIETTPSEIKIFANINKYQKCKTETQPRDQK